MRFVQALPALCCRLSVFSHWLLQEDAYRGVVRSAIERSNQRAGFTVFFVGAGISSLQVCCHGGFRKQVR